MKHHALNTVSKKTLWSVMILSFVLTVALAALLSIIGKPLHTCKAPGGILSFEFSGDFSRSQAILDSWGSAGQTVAGFSIGLDYLFLFCYPVFLSVSCILLVRGLQERFPWVYKTGIVIACLPLIAGFLDAIENTAMTLLLFGSQKHWLPGLAYYCAAPKFLLVGIAILFIITGLMLYLFKKKSTEKILNNT